MNARLTNIAGFGLKEHLALSWANQRHISHNIANANTPNFQPTRAELIQKEQEAFIELEESNSRHLSNPDPQNISILKTVPAVDFSLDSEMGEMAKNSLFYQTLLETVLRRNQMAKSVLGGQ